MRSIRSVWLAMAFACGDSDSGDPKRDPTTVNELTGDTGDTTIQGITSTTDTGTVSTATTGDTGPPWDVDYRCESFSGLPWIENIPVPTQSCTYELPVVTASRGAMVFIDAIAHTRLAGNAFANLGTSLALLPDQDGDGIGELAVGRPGFLGLYGFGETQGEVWYFPGGTPAGDLTVR